MSTHKLTLIVLGLLVLLIGSLLLSGSSGNSGNGDLISVLLCGLGVVFGVWSVLLSITTLFSYILV
jgi:hypothetical protein